MAELIDDAVAILKDVADVDGMETTFVIPPNGFHIRVLPPSVYVC